MIQYAYTILYVSSVVESLEFYEKAFGFERKFLTQELDYGELKTGETIIAFASKSLANSNLSNGFMVATQSGKPFPIEMGFTTKDVEGTIEKAIQLGAKLEEPMKSKPWGQKVAYIRDINGFLLEICTAMGA